MEFSDPEFSPHKWIDQLLEQPEISLEDVVLNLQMETKTFHVQLSNQIQQFLLTTPLYLNKIKQLKQDLHQLKDKVKSLASNSENIEESKENEIFEQLVQKDLIKERIESCLNYSKNLLKDQNQ